jgi:hypothetical protein
MMFAGTSGGLLAFQTMHSHEKIARDASIAEFVKSPDAVLRASVAQELCALCGELRGSQGRADDLSAFDQYGLWSRKRLNFEPRDQTEPKFIPHLDENGAAG